MKRRVVRGRWAAALCALALQTACADLTVLDAAAPPAPAAAAASGHTTATAPGAGVNVVVADAVGGQGGNPSATVITAANPGPGVKARAGAAPAAAPAPGSDLPPPPREFRAAWVAAVANIDWPSRPGLSAQAQRAEALAILDRARAIGLNALILQVRPAGDAIYRSALEPWSEYLSGEQGRAPWQAAEPAWDPLAFWVAQAHRRGLELHAWFNPYRARHSAARSPLVAPHIGVRNKALVKAYGDMLWMNPGEPAAAAHTLAVVADVVQRYDIDGVHIDDYFYPYPVPVPGSAPASSAPGAPPPPDLPFPDDETYAAYRLADGQLQRDDWRRANVDALVQALYDTVHRLKPWVRVGISPFGLGRPDRRPPGISGFSQLDRLYADVERWLANGWLDYLAPQLYWQIRREGQQFPVLLDYWIAQNSAQRHLWPGLFTSQVTRGEPGAVFGPRVWPARELLDQIDVLHTRPAAVTGHIHFSMAALMQNRDGIATLLHIGPYAQPALVPATPWLDSAPQLLPATPRLRASVAGSVTGSGAGNGNRTRVLLEPGAAVAGAPEAVRWAVWRRHGAVWQFDVLPAADRSLDADGADAVAVRAVDRLGKLGNAAVLQLR